MSEYTAEEWERMFDAERRLSVVHCGSCGRALQLVGPHTPGCSFYKKVCLDQHCSQYRKSVTNA